MGFLYSPSQCMKPSLYGVGTRNETVILRKYTVLYTKVAIHWVVHHDHIDVVKLKSSYPMEYIVQGTLWGVQWLQIVLLSKYMHGCFTARVLQKDWLTLRVRL